MLLLNIHYMLVPLKLLCALTFWVQSLILLTHRLVARQMSDYQKMTPESQSGPDPGDSSSVQVEDSVLSLLLLRENIHDGRSLVKTIQGSKS